MLHLIPFEVPSYSINFTAITDIALILGRIPAQSIEYIAKYFAQAPANPLDVDITPTSIAFAGVTVFAGSLLIWLWDYRIYKRELHLDYVRIPVLSMQPARAVNHQRAKSVKDTSV